MTQYTIEELKNDEDDDDEEEDEDEDEDEEYMNRPEIINIRERYDEHARSVELYIINRVRDAIRIRLNEPLGNKITDLSVPDDNKYPVFYGMFGIDNYGIRFGNMDEVPFQGIFKFGKKYNPIWDCDDEDGTRGKDYISELIDSPSWIKIAALANESILCTRDYKHVVFSGVDISELKGDTFWFSMGS